MAIKPKFIIIHCSASKGATLESMRRYHTEVKGWEDVGYHFVIEESGAIRPGRPLWKAGAHARGANDNWGICLAGPGDEPFTWQQEKALKRLCLALMLVGGIPSTNVIGHREVPTYIPRAAPVNKSCPGVVMDMDEWRGILGAAAADDHTEMLA